MTCGRQRFTKTPRLGRSGSRPVRGGADRPINLAGGPGQRARADCHVRPHAPFSWAPKRGILALKLPRHLRSAFYPAARWRLKWIKQKTRPLEETMTHRITRRGVNTGIGAALITPALSAAPAFAAGEPI